VPVGSSRFLGCDSTISLSFFPVGVLPPVFDPSFFYDTRFWSEQRDWPIFFGSMSLSPPPPSPSPAPSFAFFPLRPLISPCFFEGSLFQALKLRLLGEAISCGDQPRDCLPPAAHFEESVSPSGCGMVLPRHCPFHSNGCACPPGVCVRPGLFSWTFFLPLASESA